VVAILVLNGVPGRATEIGQERCHIGLQLLAGIHAARAAGSGQTVSPIRPPEPQIPSRGLLDAYCAGAGVAAVINEVICQRRGTRRVRLPRRPEEVLWATR